LEVKGADETQRQFLLLGKEKVWKVIIDTTDNTLYRTIPIIDGLANSTPRFIEKLSMP